MAMGEGEAAARAGAREGGRAQEQAEAEKRGASAKEEEG